MNKIIFAGKIADFGGERYDKYYEIIIPFGNEGGRLVCDTLNQAYGRGEIIVIPPNCKYFLEGHCPEDLHVLIDKALLNLKQAVIMNDVENFGIRHAALQAESFLNCAFVNKDLVLTALGNLLVSYLNLYSGAGKTSPVTERVRAELDRRVSDPTFSIENYLRKLPLNYEYLRKLFKKETGCTPHEYLLHARMELAQGLLLGRISNQYSGYTVAQVAEACGFSEPLYFSRVFKKYFGVPPSEYGK